ncbi:MAG TPA: type II toxin-antitoxin system RelE/ParE family toxin [Acidimicrobiales bacterium]|nr:type II toxin-antitoxin system RelE/ParE family toxin [Acidimicrobiales bacterium]
MGAMSWGEVELEPEVRNWFLRLGETDQARVRFHVDRLSELGPVLDEPHTRQLDGKLRELRFYLQGVPTRITYWIAPGRRIILLTVFVKTKRKEVREVQRAREAMKRCRAEGHTANEEENDDDG